MAVDEVGRDGRAGLVWGAVTPGGVGGAVVVGVRPSSEVLLDRWVRAGWVDMVRVEVALAAVVR